MTRRDLLNSFVIDLSTLTADLVRHSEDEALRKACDVLQALGDLREELEKYVALEMEIGK